MTGYHHTQVGWLSVSFLLAALAITGLVTVVTHAVQAGVVVMSILLLAAAILNASGADPSGPAR